PTEVPAPTEEVVTEPLTTTVLIDFETDGVGYDVYQATASMGDVAYAGAGSLKSESTEGEWHGVGATFPDGPVDLSGYNQICFMVYDTTTNNNGKAANTVGVKLLDTAGAATERYTDNEGVGANVKTKLNEWTPMCLNLITFTGIDMTSIEKIEFTMYWAGTYYFDEVTALPLDAEFFTAAEPTGEVVTTLAQGFEAEETYYSDYQAEVSLDTTIFHSGASALKAASTEGEWHAFGGLLDPTPFDASSYDKVCFWIYDTTEGDTGNSDNTVGVKLFDASGANEEVWTDHELAGGNPKTAKNTWVQMCINLDAYTSVDTSQLEKVQFALFWAGDYYVDDIEFVSSGGAAAAVPVLVQGFEAEETYYSDYQAEVSLDTTIFHSGASALKAASTEGEWHAFGAYPDPRPFDGSGFDKVCFWIYDTTEGDTGNSDNTVGVKLFDASGANEEVWTDHELAGGNPKTAKNTWVQMCINLDAYTSVDTSQLEKVQFALFWAGDYYVDDIEFVSSGGAAAAVPVLVQGFEAEETYYSDYQAEVSLDTTIFHSGASALKAASTEGEWHAFGAYPDPRPFDGSGFDKVCFWIYDTTEGDTGNSDNTVGVKLFDASGANEEVWTDHELAGGNPKTAKNTWVQMCINLDAYMTVDTTQIDKIQFALFWAGDYYVDDIEFVGTGSASTEPEVVEAPAPNVFVPAQDLEAEGTFAEVYQVTLSLDTEIVKSGASSLKSESTEGEWHTTSVIFDGAPVDASGYQQVCFWLYDTTANNDGKADNTIALKLFDATGANQEFWSDNAAIGTNGKSVQNEWTQFCFGLDAYTDIDLTQLEHAEFALYWFGTYYFDGIEFASYDPNAAAAPKTGDLAQDFEADGTSYEVYQVTLSLDTEIVKSGASSLKSESTEGEWHTTGINFDGAPVDASGYSAICFWWYDTTANNSGKADNTIALKLFDATGANQEFWSDNAAIGTNGKSVQNEWVQSCFNLEAYTDIDLTQLEKAEVALYWFGTYYFDLVEFIP
ncbi:MAG TPA: hypothetical protein PK530_07350, partial [Anaerolineales bacterium]|nr:hypothetical protein [Anaerolineales bacterium]